MSESIRVEIRRDQGDYFSAVWANYWHGGGFWWVIIGAIAFSCVSFFIQVSAGEPAAVFYAAETAVFFVALILPLHLMTMWLTARASWKQPGAQDPIVYVFTSEALEVQSGLGSGVSKWTAYRRAFENSRVLVIRHHVNIMQLLPKRDIPPETMRALRKLLREVLAGRVAFKREQS